MSKIGRKPIAIENVTVTIEGQSIHYKGKNSSGIYVVPDFLRIQFDKNIIRLQLADPADTEHNNFWGMHRALLANTLAGAQKEFSTNVVIVGLGFKGELKKDEIEFSLGYSHKINFKIPKNVKIEIDKTGQNLKISSYDKFLMGDVAQRICALRRPEPYKGTGVRLESEEIFRKVGKS